MQKIIPALKALLVGSICLLAIIVVVNLIFGNHTAAAQMLIPLCSGLFAFWFIGRANWMSVKCPNCQTQQPLWRQPSSMRQLMWGGWTCANCGTELDRHGRAIGEKV